MARMLNAHAARWQRATATYGYDVKGKLRAREERSWRRDWAEDALDAEQERWSLEWARPTFVRMGIDLADYLAGSLIWNGTLPSGSSV